MEVCVHNNYHLEILESKFEIGKSNHIYREW